MIKKAIFSSLILSIFLLIASSAFAKTVALAWDPSDDPEVTGYRLYYKINSSSLPFDGSGASEGVSPIDVGDTLTTTLNGLQEGDVVYFAVTAYNAFGEESDFSNVVASEWIPEVYAPASGETVQTPQVEFSWAAAPGSGFTYTLVYGSDPQLKSTSLASQSFGGTSLLAGAAFFGLFAAALPARRQRQALLAVTVAGALFLLVGCGGGGGGSDSPAKTPGNDGVSTAEVTGISGTSYTAELQGNTTYYWKVIAVDAQGQRRESETRSFTTGAF